MFARINRRTIRLYRHYPPPQWTQPPLQPNSVNSYQQPFYGGYISPYSGGGYMQPSIQYDPHPYYQGSHKKNQSFQSIYNNPLQPLENGENIGKNNYMYQQQMPYLHPYPKQSFITNQQSGAKSVLNSFKNQEGKLDFNKMVDTAGSMMNAVTQVSSMVKGIGGIFKI